VIWVMGFILWIVFGLVISLIFGIIIEHNDEDMDV